MILAVDATNWIHSLWHAQRGQGILPAVRARLQALAERYEPQHLVACFDRRSFRHDLFPDYKAGRKQKPESLCRDLAEAPEFLGNIATVCQEDGFEADDCLASLAAAGQQIGQQVILASPDKDLRQCLVVGQVTILRSFSLDRGQVAEVCWYTATDLNNEYGLTPVQWVTYQALVGDATEGIPGCAGWGEKTVLAVMARFFTLAEIFANPWSLPITQKQQLPLGKFKMQAQKMLSLVTLRTDAAAAWDAIR